MFIYTVQASICNKLKNSFNLNFLSTYALKFIFGAFVLGPAKQLNFSYLSKLSVHNSAAFQGQN